MRPGDRERTFLKIRNTFKHLNKETLEGGHS